MLPECEWGRGERAGTTQGESPHVDTKGKRRPDTTRKCGVIGLEQGKGGPISVEKAVVLTLPAFLPPWLRITQREAGKKRYGACT